MRLFLARSTFVPKMGLVNKFASFSVFYSSYIIYKQQESEKSLKLL